MLILVIFPNIIEFLATSLGFKEAPNMLFLIAIFILFYIVFAIYTTITKLIESNKIIVQELSILKRNIWETTYRGIYSDDKINNYSYSDNEEKFLNIISNKNIDFL